MKTREIKGQELQTSSGLNGQDFGIRSQDVNFILSILRDGMYEDPIGSMCRELISNCVDAHVEAGKRDLPIEIILPSMFESSIKFIDYGNGMSPEFINENYRNFGASTKCYSDDVIGGLGVGSKSPWAYSDTFTVETINKGVKYTYSCYIDEMERGKIFLLSEEETNLSSGTKVTVPVKSSDYNSFKDKVIYYSKYLAVKPLISPKVEGLDNSKNIYVSGTNWETYTSKSGQSGCLIVMGGVPYPINSKSLDPRLRMDHIFSIPFSYFCSIGDVDVAANRENLRYTPKTVSFITSMISKMKNEFPSSFSKGLNNCNSLLNACLTLKNLDYNYKRTFFIYLPNYSYKGMPVYIDGYKLHCEPSSKGKIVRQVYKVRNKDGSLVPYVSSTDEILKIDICNRAYLINDLDKLTDSRYVEAVFESKGPHEVVVFKNLEKALDPSDLYFVDSASNKFNDLSQLGVELFSNITPKERQKTIISGASIVNTISSTPKPRRPKNHITLLKFGASNNSINSIGLYSKSSVEDVPLSQGGYYLKVDKGTSSLFNHSNVLIDVLKEMDISDLYLVRKKSWPLIESQSNWKDLEKEIYERVERLTTDEYLDYLTFNSKIYIRDTTVDFILKNPAPSLFKQYLERRDLCCKEKVDPLVKRYAHKLLNNNRVNKLAQLEEKCLERYKLFKYAGLLNFGDKEAILEYIDLIEKNT